MSVAVLDLKTVMMMDVMIGFCLSIFMTFSALDRMACPGIRFWWGAFISWTIGFTFIISRGIIPLWVSVCFGNSLVFMGYLLLWLGVKQYKKKLFFYHKHLLWLSILLFFVLYLLTNGAEDNTYALRVNIISSVILVMSGIIIFELLDGIKFNETGRILCVLSFFMVILVMIFRIIAMHFLEFEHLVFNSHVSNQIFGLVFSAAFLITGTSVFMMNSQWLQHRLYIHATYDALTGVYNRYALLELSDTLELTANIASKVWSLILIDLDYFKKINDQFGHPVGDQVLQKIAKQLKANARHHDIVARYGGEEFVVILPDCSTENAVKWANKLRATVEESVFDMDGHHFNVTVSVGIAAATDQCWRFVDVLHRADQALYLAKNSGRNQVKTDLDVQVLDLHAQPEYQISHFN